MNKKRGKASSIPGQPTRDEFVAYAQELSVRAVNPIKIDPDRAGDQWDIWDAGDWCDGNNTPILNWKGKLTTYAKGGFGVFGSRGSYQRFQAPPPRDRIAEAQEEYEQRQRYKPEGL